MWCYKHLCHFNYSTLQFKLKLWLGKFWYTRYSFLQFIQLAWVVRCIVWHYFWINPYMNIINTCIRKKTIKYTCALNTCICSFKNQMHPVLPVFNICWIVCLECFYCCRWCFHRTCLRTFSPWSDVTYWASIDMPRPAHLR